MDVIHVCMSMFEIVRYLSIKSLLFEVYRSCKFIHEPKDVVLYLLTGNKSVYYVLLLLFLNT